MRCHLSRRALLGALALPAAAAAQERGQLRIIVPFPPGGASDLIARFFAQRLGERREGASVAVVNRPGGAAAIGTEAAARAAADGQTLLLGASYLATAPHLFASLPYDPARDFAPLGVGVSIPLVLYASAAFARDLPSALERLRARPGAYNFASAGNATLAHVGAVLFMQRTGTELVHVPYQGTAPAMTDMAAGRAQLIIDGVGAGLPQVEAGRLVPLLMTGERRHPRFPGVPTSAEAGLDGFVVGSWNAFFAPAATPAQLVARLAAELGAIAGEPATRAWLEERNFEPLVEPPAAFAARLASESAAWGEVIRRGGIRAD
jgi:tripartite-type tricarboxylate transporter receptor subunit TctC